MKTKGPPIFLFIIALIVVCFIGYWNFSKTNGPSITDLLNKLTVLWDSDAAVAAATEFEAKESTAKASEDANTTATTASGIVDESAEAIDETTESQTPEEVDAARAFDALTDINVDRNLLTVNITLPADFVGEITQKEVDESVAQDIGLLSGVLNDDGSVSYVMSYLKYKEMLDETKKSIEDGLQEIVDSDEFPNIVGISHNDDFTEYKISYKGKEVAFTDGFQVLACYMYSGFYAIFKGEPIDNVHVVFVNSDTGAVISETNSRDMGKEE